MISIADVAGQGALQEFPDKSPHGAGENESRLVNISRHLACHKGSRIR
jgi:hypothetical protein